MSYTFFYDESSHTRKITGPAILAENYFETFICSIVGFDNKQLSAVKNEYLSFEQKYKKIYDVSGEFKLNVISTKRFKYGFASLFRQNDIDLINDYLDFLLENNAYVFYCFLDKITHIIEQIFKKYCFASISPKHWTYSVAKPLRVYRPENVILCLFNKPQLFVKTFKNFLIKQQRVNKANPVKALENKVFETLIEGIDDGINVDFDIKWNYNPQFQGFKLFLNEKKISLSSLYLDEEVGHPETLLAAQKYFDKKFLINAKSHECWGVRVADIFSSLLYKLSKSMNDYIDSHTTTIKDKKYTNGEIYKMGILDEHWFKLTRIQFDLYKKMKKVAIDLNSGYFKSYVDISVDNLLMLTRFLWYIGSFDSFNKYQKKSTQEHMICFHNFSMRELQASLDNL